MLGAKGVLWLAVLMRCGDGVRRVLSRRAAFQSRRTPGMRTSARSSRQIRLGPLGFFEPPQALRGIADIFLEAGQSAGRRPRRSDIRIPRYVHVSDSVKKARAEVWAAYAPLLERRKHDFAYQFQRLIPPGGTLDDVTF